MKNYDYILVGNGLAAHFVLFYLSKNENSKKASILHISDEKYYPASSLLSLGVVARRGAKDNSPLGNLINLAFNSFEEFFAKEQKKIKGITPVNLINICHPGGPLEEDFKRRFGENIVLNKTDFSKDVWYNNENAYIVNSSLLLTSLNNNRLSDYTKINKSIYLPSIEKEFSGFVTELGKGERFYGKKLILCCGHYGKFTCGQMKQDLVDYENNPGFYIKWSHQNDHKLIPCIYNYNELGFIIDQNVCKLGPFKPKEHAGWMSKAKKFQEILKKQENHFSLLTQLIEKGEIIYGNRLKGPKRMPQWGSKQKIGVQSYPYYLHALHKNGVLFSHYGGLKLSEIVGMSKINLI